ncbi:MAG: hypothetical protein DCC75_09155, partial [Proteobacteria bacterium]
MDSHKPSDHEKNLDLLFEESRDGFGIRGYTTPDQLKLFLTIDAHPSGTHLHKDLLLEVLAEKGFDLEHLNLGVLDDIVRVINHGEILNEPRRVLIGTPPLNGENGRIVFLVKKFIGAPEVQVDPAGRAHFAELHLFDNVTKGDRIARILPAEPGKDGLDIFGKIISHTPGREYVYQLDPSVRLVKDRADGQQSTFLAADVSGYVREIEGFISIEPCLSIQGNLDFNQGNVDFVGAVEIAGDVMPGFNVKAAYGISVGGSVRGGSLLTTEGEIKVGGYIYGGSSSIVRAGRNLFAGVVQDANTEIIGDIYIRTESLNSTLRTSGRLYMPDANLIGGEVFSVGGVEARDIGNDAGVRTIINLSSDQQASLAYTKLQVQIEVQKAGIN